MQTLKALLLAASLLGGAATAHASTVLVVDPSGFGGFESGAASDWNAGTSSGLTAMTTVPVTGNFSIISNDPGSAFSGANYGQAVGNLTTDWEYIGLQNLAVANGALITVSAEVYANTPADAFGISYGTHGITFASNTPMQYYNFTTSDTTPGGYVPVTFTFTATSSNLDLYFGFLDGSGSPIYIDNVSVSYDDGESVPEPVSLALLGAGVLGLGLIRRRRAG